MNSSRGQPLPHAYTATAARSSTAPTTQLPPLPSSTASSSSRTSYSSSGGAGPRYHPPAAAYPTTDPPDSPERHPDPLRQRGQSSPVTSRHQLPGTATAGDLYEGRQSRRQSSSTTPRRIIDGREETREERRVRKERERAMRGDHGEGDEASPTASARRRSSRSNGLPNSPDGGEADLSALSLGSPPLAHASTRAPAPSASSKSVLTIALQRAQSAVLLDSANNVPAAISAYTQSVRLLKEVMQRVEESARREREKEASRGYDWTQPRAGETREEFSRRVTKAEKKEKAKQDEARRLRVIHDTYEDRIRMLQTVDEPSGELNPPPDDGSSPSTPSTIHAHSPSAPSASTLTSEPVIRQHSSSRSITSLGTVSTPPATFATLGGTPPPTLVVQQPTLGRPFTTYSEPAEEIGNAMLAGSPPASPMDPKMPAPRAAPSISSLPVLGDASQPYSYGSHRVAPSMGRRPSIADQTIDEEGDELPLVFNSRASISSDATATSMSRARTVAGPADPSIPFRSHAPPEIAIEPHSPRAAKAIDLTYLPADEEEEEEETNAAAHRAVARIPRSDSYTSSEDDDAVPVTAMEYGVGWPTERMDSDVEAEATDRDEIEVAGQAYSSVATSASSPSSMRRSDSSQSASAGSMRRIASGDSMHRTASGDSVSAMSMRGSSLFGPGGFTQMSNVLPPPPAADHPSPRYSTPAVGLGHPASAPAARPRPGRSASLASTPTYAPSSTSSSKRAGPPLISSTTSLGTISQRRKAPHPNGAAHEQGQEDDESEEELEGVCDEEGHTVQQQSLPRLGRPISAERTIAGEFGLQPHSAGSSGSYASASLPTRLRTSSQPQTKRPSLLSHQSEQPPLPAMLGSTPRSMSGPSPPLGYPRKGSIPGTSSGLSLVNLPPLGRSNSSSSQGSFSERERDSRGGSPYSTYGSLGQSQSSLPSSYAAVSGGAGSDTPTYSTFPRGAGAVPPTLSSPPPLTASSHSSMSTQSIVPLRRPFHLLRSVLQSLEGTGAYVTPRLYVPPQVWNQSGVKLVAVETKVRMLDLLLSGLDAVNKGSSGWVEGGQGHRAFAGELESLEGLMEGIQSTLSKKLGYKTSGKKTGGTSFSAWSSKLSRSLDRVANGRSLDKPDVYSEILTKVLRGAHILDAHLELLLDKRGPQGPYAELTLIERARIEQRLKRASDFFGQVVCRFVMRDIGMLVDKYVKRAGTWLGE